MTLRNLNDHGRINYQDFLDRADLLGALGYPVLISNYDTHYRLASFLFRHTQKPMGIVMGVPTLREIFDEKYYNHLSRIKDITPEPGKNIHLVYKVLF